MKRPFILPEASLWYGVAIQEGYAVRRSHLSAPFCTHPAAADFALVDRRAGPGAFADNFEGLACTHCGRVLTWRQTL